MVRSQPDRRIGQVGHNAVGTVEPITRATSSALTATFRAVGRDWSGVRGRRSRNICRRLKCRLQVQLVHLAYEVHAEAVMRLLLHQAEPS
jgi:hypothetical protein